CHEDWRTDHGLLAQITVRVCLTRNRKARVSRDIRWRRAEMHGHCSRLIPRPWQRFECRTCCTQVAQYGWQDAPRHAVQIVENEDDALAIVVSVIRIMEIPHRYRRSQHVRDNGVIELSRIETDIRRH